MKKYQTQFLKYSTFILTTIAISTNATSFAVNANSSTIAKTPKAPCRLELETPHISGSLQKSLGTTNVKANVSSICDLPQSQTQITVSLYKMGLIDHVVAQKMFHMSKTELPKLIVDFKATYALCVTKEPTRYYTKAFSKSFIGGRWLYAGQVKSPTSEKLLCGTKSLNPIS